MAFFYKASDSAMTGTSSNTSRPTDNVTTVTSSIKSQQNIMATGANADEISMNFVVHLQQGEAMAIFFE